MAFPSDLSDAQWERVRDLFASRRAATPQIERRQMVNAILYLALIGAQRRYLPGEFGSWGAAWQHFRCWRDPGVRGEAMRRVAVCVRQREQRDAYSSLLLVDGQTSLFGSPTPSARSVGTVWDDAQQGWDFG